MDRYAPRLVHAASVPTGALVEPLVADPPASPLGEHELIPVVAWMVERDGAWEHVPDTQRGELEAMRGFAMLTMLDEENANEALEALPGVNLATNGTYAAELFLDADHLAALHTILGGRVYLAAVPRRGRFLVGGVGAGVEGMRAFVEHARREHDAADLPERISPVSLFVRDGVPTAVVGEMQLAALAQSAR